MSDFLFEIELPSNWQIKSIADVYRFTKKPRELKPSPDVKIPFIPMDQVPQGGALRVGFIERELGSITSGTYFERGDFLLSKITPSFENGKQGIADNIPAEFGYATTEVIPIQEIEGVSNKHFLFYFLLLPPVRHSIASRMEGSTGRQRVPDSLIREWKIPLPPLNEQRAIASVLEKIQQAIEVETSLIRVSRELKAAVMNQLFTKGLRGEPQKETEIGLVPESWEVVPLGDEFDTQLGKMLSQKAKTGSNPSLYLRNKNVQWGRIDTSDLLRMDFDEREKLKFKLIPGDLLVCEGGEPGRAALWHGEIRDCYYQKALHRLRTKGSISNEFLSCWLEYSIAVANLYRNAGASSTIAHLPEIQLKLLNIPKPSPQEQAAVCSIIESISSLLDTHNQKLKLLEELFAALLSSLMSAEIRVTDLDLNASLNPSVPMDLEYGGTQP